MVLHCTSRRGEDEFDELLITSRLNSASHYSARVIHLSFTLYVLHAIDFVYSVSLFCTCHSPVIHAICSSCHRFCVLCFITLHVSSTCHSRYMFFMPSILCTLFHYSARVIHLSFTLYVLHAIDFVYSVSLFCTCHSPVIHAICSSCHRFCVLCFIILHVSSTCHSRYMFFMPSILCTLFHYSARVIHLSFTLYVLHAIDSVYSVSLFCTCHSPVIHAICSSCHRFCVLCFIILHVSFTCHSRYMFFMPSILCTLFHYSARVIHLSFTLYVLHAIDSVYSVSLFCTCHPPVIHAICSSCHRFCVLCFWWVGLACVLCVFLWLDLIGLNCA